jgi:hypothetical protein
MLRNMVGGLPALASSWIQHVRVVVLLDVGAGVYTEHDGPYYNGTFIVSSSVIDSNQATFCKLFLVRVFPQAAHTVWLLQLEAASTRKILGAPWNFPR